MVSIHDSQDVRVWGSSCILSVVAKDLYDLYRRELLRRLDDAWIWRLRIHLRVSLYIWNVVTSHQNGIKG